MRIWQWGGIVGGVVLGFAAVIGLFADWAEISDWFDRIREKTPARIERREESLAPLPAGAIEFTLPMTGATVPWHGAVEGRVNPNANEVWLIIHPVINNDCWVQPRAAIQNGRWRVNATFGNFDSEGAQFEMMAVADSTVPLREGQAVSCWPEAAAQSEIVTSLTRN